MDSDPYRSTLCKDIRTPSLARYPPPPPCPPWSTDFTPTPIIYGPCVSSCSRPRATRPPGDGHSQIATRLSGGIIPPDSHPEGGSDRGNSAAFPSLGPPTFSVSPRPRAPGIFFRRSGGALLHDQPLADASILVLLLVFLLVRSPGSIQPANLFIANLLGLSIFLRR
jgi:hypothetical protein